MKFVEHAAWILVIAVTAAATVRAEHNVPITENAALRYWAAFSEVRDSAVTAQQAKELTAVLDGTAPYDDSKYRELLKKNESALEVMLRGTSLRNCDWGLDYGLGPKAPVEYVRKALVLGRLNVLYSFHLLKTGNQNGAVDALAAGLRFSRDVASGGSLFAMLVAKSLLTDHLRAVARIEHATTNQRSELQTAVAGLGEGLDWSSAAKRDLETLRLDHTDSWEMSAALNRIINVSVAVLDHKANIDDLNQALKGAPKYLAGVIPNIEGVLKQKQDLTDRIRQTRSLLR